MAQQVSRYANGLEAFLSLKLCGLACWVCLHLAVPLHAQELADVLEKPIEDPRNSAQLSSEYGGLVTRQVLTSMGQLFHAKFTEMWQTNENFEQFNILVKERPYPRGGTEVMVVYEDQVMFRRALPRDVRTLVKLSEEAAVSVYDRASEFEVQRLLFTDVDLAASGY